MSRLGSLTTLFGGQVAASAFRLGSFLMVLSLVCAVIIISVPVVDSEEGSVTYFRMVDEREGNFTSTPGMPAVQNGFALRYVNLGLLAFLLLASMGALLVLEGLGKVSVLRHFPWRPDAKAVLALSAAILLAVTATFAMSSVWRLAADVPTVEDGGEAADASTSGPAGAVAACIGVGMTAVLLLMLVRASLGAADRARRPAPARAHAVMASAMVAVCIAGILLLGATRVATVQGHSDIPAVSTVATFPLSSAHVDRLADIPDVAPAVDSLDARVTATGWALFLCLAFSLLGMVGLAGRPFGEGGAGDRLALGLSSIPTLIAVVAVVASILAAVVVQDAGEAVVGTMLGDDLAGMQATTALSLALPLAIGLSMVGLVVATLQTRRLLSRAAPAAGGDQEPGEGGSVEEAERDVLTSRAVRRELIAILVAVLLVFAGGGVVAVVGAGKLGDFEPFGGVKSLAPWNATVSELDEYLDEYDYEYYPFMTTAIGNVDEESTRVYMINHVTAQLTWEDEADVSRVIATWENQPDRFTLYLADYWDNFYLQESDTNEPGGTGSIVLEWSGGDTYICFGNQTLIRDEGITMVWDDGMMAAVELGMCGDCTHPIRPTTYTDSGNSFDLAISLSGYFYEY